MGKTLHVVPGLETLGTAETTTVHLHVDIVYVYYLMMVYNNLSDPAVSQCSFSKAKKKKPIIRMQEAEFQLQLNRPKLQLISFYRNFFIMSNLAYHYKNEICIYKIHISKKRNEKYDIKISSKFNLKYC